MHFYTSINNNYLPKARVLARSVKEYCHDVKFSLVLADSVPREINIDQEPFDEIITLEELKIPVENLQLWIFQHTAVELCTAIKGQALVNFLEQGSEAVVYLDPDIVVFDELMELDKLLDIYDVILTPHQTVPENNKRDIINNEICSLQHGVYNFGFYAVKNSPNGLQFAHWWRDRLVDFCYDDISNGIFTDQRWGDLVPALFEGVHIWKNPGCNVATWNLTNRQITKNGNEFFVNGHKLKFYHFSGFDSGAQKTMLDIYGDGNPYLYELRQWYIEQQNLEGQGIYGVGNKPTRYNYYDNGELISGDERSLLRKRMDLLEYFGKINPYQVDQERSYYYWYRNEHKKELSATKIMVNGEQYMGVKEQITQILSRISEVTAECQNLQRKYELILKNNQK